MEYWILLCLTTCRKYFHNRSYIDTCKRLNLFLKWMVRKDRVDPGGWTSIPRSRLIIPLDVHIHRFAGLMGLTSRKQGNMRTAVEVTGSLREFDSSDPVKYDFSITRLGIRRDADREMLIEELRAAAGGAVR